jgi:glycosyltransferase involved in cell wall biosynthesis
MLINDTQVNYKMITFFIPIYNENVRKNLSPFLSDLSNFILKPHNINNNFILVNDGSTDNSKNLLENFYKKLNKKVKKNIFIIENKKNMGVGFSFRKALKICKTKYFMPIPADNDVPLLNFNKYIKKDIDFIMFYMSNMNRYSRNRYALSMLFRLFYGYCFDIQVNYIQSPCIYKYKVLKKIKIISDRMSFWPELNIKFLKSKIKYSEEGIIFKNKSDIDRTVSVKNFIEVVYRFINILIDVNIINKKQYKFKAKKIYN